MPGRQILDAIGDTPLVRLQRAAPPGAATTVAKLELANPTGSMKDRMARAAIEAAAADGRLPPGGTVGEYTAGTTGISLAFVCAALGYDLEIIFLMRASVMRLLSLETSVMRAPKVCIVTRFSSLNASEKTISRS